MKKQYCGTRDKEKRAAAMMQQLLFMANHANNDTNVPRGSRRGAFCSVRGAFSVSGVHLDKLELIHWEEQSNTSLETPFHLAHKRWIHIILR